MSSFKKWIEIYKRNCELCDTLSKTISYEIVREIPANRSGDFNYESITYEICYVCKKTIIYNYVYKSGLKNVWINHQDFLNYNGLNNCWKNRKGKFYVIDGPRTYRYGLPNKNSEVFQTFRNDTRKKLCRKWWLKSTIQTIKLLMTYSDCRLFLIPNEIITLLISFL